ncbi:class I SAM-dependent methyltransferase [Patescibacteria group bacterium]|nr:class I SAM-dependent methyltransferase [Patescibacteria group bacterium]
MNLVSKSNWKKYWSEHGAQKIHSILFEDIFQKYFEFNPKLECIEIGCVPGNFLIFLHKKFGYKIHGIDYVEGMEKILKKNFELNNIKNYNIYNSDFRIFKQEKLFDIVLSIGFIEHFSDYKKIIEKHISLLKKDGILFISLPNFRYGQYLLHRLFDNKNLKKHNLKAMNPKIIKEIFKKNNLEIIYSGYYKSFKFWVENIENRNFFIKKIIVLIILIGQFFFKYINIPNKYFSPFIICIAKKK